MSDAEFDGDVFPLLSVTSKVNDSVLASLGAVNEGVAVSEPVSTMPLFDVQVYEDMVPSVS